MNHSLSESLRQFLFDVPFDLNFIISDLVKYEIRKKLFQIITCDGKYLNLVFPEIEILQLEEELQWLLKNYVAYFAEKLQTSHGRNPHAFHSGQPCARVFRKGEPIYKCLTCGLNDTCALCSNCFQEESHDGHNINVSICVRENGGVCDCGDPEAWVKDFLCVYHEMNKSFERLRDMSPSSELKRAVLDTVGILLDFVIDVMCRSDQQFSFPDSLNDAQWQSRTCGLDPHKYASDAGRYCDNNIPDKFALIAYNDQVRHFRDAFQRIHLTSKKVPEFAEMVARRIQEHGRATVIRSSDVRLLYERQKILSSTGLSSCIRNVCDEFREEMCFEIVQWLEDFSSCDFVKANETIRNSFCQAFCMKWNRGVTSSGSTYTMKRSIAQLDVDLEIPMINRLNVDMPKIWKQEPKPWEHIKSLCQECGYNVWDSSGGKHFGSRLQYLTYLDIRFWKAFRLSLHTMYASSLITNLKWKGLFCYQYCDVYPFISDMFLNLDGDPETNVMCTLSCQLFISPSNSSAILVNGDVSQIFKTIYLFLKSGNTHSTTMRNNFDLLMASLKNRRWGQLFFDIGYIVSRGQNSKVSMNEAIVPMTCELLALFQGKPTMKREIESHIEYENSDYTAFFHAIPVIYQLADYISQCLKNVESFSSRQNSFKSAIIYVTKFILLLRGRSVGSKDHNEVDYAHENDMTLEQNEMVIQSTASFLHPLHLFLSWLIEYASFNEKDTLVDLLETASKECCERTPSFSSPILQLFYYPLQSVVLAAQIKTGFWVRNGFSVKNQYQLYKSTGLREQGFHRDIFLLQIYLICFDYENAIDNILKVWLLNDDFHDCNNCAYESAILPYILEECLGFFLHVLTEGSFLQNLTSSEITKKKIEDEIIHQLVLGNMSYSKLCSQIPDHIVTERMFDTVLEEVSYFKEPLSGKESGKFALKEAYYKKINPYYHNYTLNKKDECLKLMKERAHRQTHQSLSEIVIHPMGIQKAEGIYSHIGEFTTSRSFIDFLMKCLQFVLSSGTQKFDGLLDTLLHLVHTCALESSRNSFQNDFCTKIFNEASTEISLVHLLYSGLLRDEFKEHHSKIRAIFKCFEVRLENFVSLVCQRIKHFEPKYLEASFGSSSENDIERKKKTALQRQAKLMEKFRRQQSLFLSKNDINAEYSDAEMEDADSEGWKFPDSHCILCQDTAKDAGPFGLIVHISRSSEFRYVPFEDKYWFLKAFSDNANLNESEIDAPPELKTKRFRDFMRYVELNSVIGPGFSDAKYINTKLISLTCGHGMHFNCYVQYLSSNRSRSNHITRNTPDNIEHREFLCPLCKALNNMFIPVLWTTNNRSIKSFLSPGMSEQSPLEEILELQIHDRAWLDQFCKAASDDLQEYSIISSSARSLIGRYSETPATVGQQQFRVLLSNMFQILSLLTFPQIFKADSSDLLVNTIKSTEISLRGLASNSGLVPHQISNNALINLRALNEFRITSLLMKTSNWLNNVPHKPDTHVKILANFLTLCPDRFNESILHFDFMEILVDVFPIPSLGFTFHEILRACFIGHIIQSLHIIAIKSLEGNFFQNEFYSMVDVPYSEMVAKEDGVSALTIFDQIIREGLGAIPEIIPKHPSLGRIVYSMLLKCVTPFLRQAAIYAFVNCHCDSESFNESGDAIFEADELCHWLKLPSLSKALGDMIPTKQGAITMESRRFVAFLLFLEKHNATSVEQREVCKHLEYPGYIQLIRLPLRLDDFFTKYYYLERFGLPHLRIENPAVCMFCGEVRDLQKVALGSKFGQCSIHLMKECPNNAGIFLLPKDRSILLLNKNGGSFHALPYLDLHYEVAGDNRKTKVVHLLRERYEEFIRVIWLQHNISNYIVRKLDGVIDAGGWQTL